MVRDVLDDVFPIGKGTPKLGSLSYWARWAQSFLGQQVYYSIYHVFTYNIKWFTNMGTWE
jgi:hypothetical protein